MRQKFLFMRIFAALGVRADDPEELHLKKNLLVADRFEEVSILFADMAGFNGLFAQFPPVQIVQLLNEYFSYFDSLCERHGVEKIRTIGDNYMAAGAGGR